DFQLRREIAQDDVRCRMESQRGSDQIDERRGLQQRQARKVAVARDLAILLLAANAQPIIGRLQRQMNVLAGFQLNNRQPPSTRHGEKIENAVFSTRVCKDLGIDKTLIEHGVNAGNIFADYGFQPALRLRAEERMPRVGCQRVPENLEIMEQLLYGGTRTGSELFAGVAGPKKDAAILPAREGEPAKTKPHFTGLGHRMQRYGLWRDGN